MAGSELDAAELQQQQAAMRAREEQRDLMISTVLTKEARSRLSNIRMVKPDKARGVEQLLLSAAQSGQISAAKPLDERGIVSLLEQISAKEQKASAKIVTRRKKSIDSSSDEDY